jgi:Protein of unknown function (DUF1579)
MNEHDNPCHELKQLDFLVGSWSTEGEMLSGVFNPAIKIKGTDSYEWVSGGCFLLHRVDVQMGKEKVEVIELIGNYDTSNKTFLMRSFDNHGEFTTMLASIESGDTLKISGKGMRSTLVRSKNGTQMTAYWERSDDGSAWVPWMEMRFTK